MPTQVYAVIYDDARNFLVGRKNKFGYFFQTKGGRLVPNGQKLNGSGKYCFPGGGLEGKDASMGAQIEFFEETKTKIDLNTAKLQPKPYYNNDDKKSINTPDSISGSIASI